MGNRVPGKVAESPATQRQPVRTLCASSMPIPSRPMARRNVTGSDAEVGLFNPRPFGARCREGPGARGRGDPRVGGVNSRIGMAGRRRKRAAYQRRVQRATLRDADVRQPTARTPTSSARLAFEGASTAGPSPSKVARLDRSSVACDQADGRHRPVRHRASRELRERTQASANRR